jgi:hypothetical protein
MAILDSQTFKFHGVSSPYIGPMPGLLDLHGLLVLAVCHDLSDCAILTQETEGFGWNMAPPSNAGLHHV